MFEVATNWDLADKWAAVQANLDAAGGPPRELRCNDGTVNPADVVFSNFLSSSVGSFPYFLASGQTTWETNAPRLLTGWTRGVIDTCQLSDRCIDEYESINCVLGTCSVAFEGINIMTMRYLNDRDPRRTGIVIADFPGPHLIESVIRQNSR